MPCPHKFEKELSLKGISYKPTTLIVGTFNPSWPEGNYAEWFYGRTDNNYFWEVLPRVYGEKSLLNSGSDKWKSFCEKHTIAITDLIACINDADEEDTDHEELLGGYSDMAIANSFSKFETNHIKEVLKNHPSIQHVYLTRKGQGKLWKKLWKEVEHECEKRGVEFVQELLTPSKYARFQFGRDKKKLKTKATKLEDYILERWKAKWHNQPNP